MKICKRGIDHLQKYSTKCGWTFGAFSGNIPGATEHPKKNIPDFLDRMFQTKICGFFFFKVIFEISLKVYSEK